MDGSVWFANRSLTVPSWRIDLVRLVLVLSKPSLAFALEGNSYIALTGFGKPGVSSGAKHAARTLLTERLCWQSHVGHNHQPLVGNSSFGFTQAGFL